LFGGSYDHNARGVNDIEPAYLGTPPLVPTPWNLREYLYDRTRYGFGGEGDYKIGDMSSVYLRGLYSKSRTLANSGIYAGNRHIRHRSWDPNNTCGITTSGDAQGCGSIVYRMESKATATDFQCASWGTARDSKHSYFLRGRPFAGPLHWGLPAPGFGGPSNIPFAVDTKDPFLPKFQALNGANIFDLSQYTLGFGFNENNSISSAM